VTSLAALLPASARPIAVGRYLRLAKPGIAALCTLSAAAAFCMAAPPTGRIVLPLAGLALLAGGAGALNQVQERELDARMPRTRRRPLPAGEVEPREALLFSVSLLLPGLLLLQCGGRPVTALLGLGAVIWYNGIYTPLKRRTALAPFAGAFVRAIPPAIGWISAGGVPGDPRLTALCALLVLWQVPHVGLLLLAHGEEHAAAGLPVPVGAGPRRILARTAFLGVLATAAGGLFFPFLSLAAPAHLLLAAAATTTVAAARGVPSGERAVCRRAFRAVNAYLVLILVLAVLTGRAGG
jgi:protoheme IX farnesyltransferase